MTVFKTKKNYSFEAVRFDGTNQAEIKEFGGDNVQLWPDGSIYAMVDGDLCRCFDHTHIAAIFKGTYLCKDKNGFFVLHDVDFENNRVIEPAITFHAEEEEE